MVDRHAVGTGGGRRSRRNGNDSQPEAAGKDQTARSGHPLLRSPHITGVLAGAEQPAVDVADRADRHHLASRDGCHRLVDERHPLGDSPGDHVSLSQQGERVELEVRVAEPSRNRERRGREPYSLRCVAREGRPREGDPTVRRGLLDPLEQGLGARQPSAGGGHVPVHRAVEERELAPERRRLRRPAALPVRRKRTLPELDRVVVLPLEVSRLAQAVPRPPVPVATIAAVAAVALFLAWVLLRPRRRPA